jgi:hypothetical protein
MTYGRRFSVYVLITSYICRKSSGVCGKRKNLSASASLSDGAIIYSVEIITTPENSNPSRMNLLRPYVFSVYFVSSSMLRGSKCSFIFINVFRYFRFYSCL